MVHPVLMGLIGGALAAKFILRRRFGGGCWHGHGHGRHSWRHRGFRPGRVIRLMHELDLSPAQKDAFEEILAELREEAGGLRDGGRSALAAAMGALGDDDFDRAAVEAAAAKQSEAFGRVRTKLIDALERAHAILIPEQREKLRRLLHFERGDDGGRASL
jgi:Spy/CpxP family protein refolding chaperone